MSLHIHATWRPAVNMVGILVLAIGSLASLVLAYSIGDQSVEAATPPDSCFAFSAGTITDYYDHENNNPVQPACPTVVEIPGTIGGSPVTTIGTSSFSGSGVTAVSLPASVSLIESSAFSGLSLTGLSINSGGDLLIDNSAFGGTSLTASSLTIAAAGNLTMLYSFNGGVSLSGTLTLHAGGNLETANAAFGGNTLHAVQLIADSGDITFTSGSFSGAHADQVSMTAANNITIASGSFGSVTGVDLHAGGNISIQNGAFSGSNIGGSLVIDAGGTTLIDGAMSAGSLTDVTITSVGDITLGDTVFGAHEGYLATATLDSTAGAVRVNRAFYGGTGFTLADLTIRAADGLYIDNGFLGGSPSLDVHLDIDGDVVVENGSFVNAQVDSFDIDTSGSITMSNGIFGGTGYIRSVDWKAGGDLTLVGDPWSSWWGNQYRLGSTTAISLKAGHNLSVGDEIFAQIFNVESLSLEAGGSAYFGNQVFSYGQITSLTLPAGTTHIGDEAFSYNNLDSVYLQGATPTIGDYAFSFSGVTTTWPPDSSLEHPPVDNFENVRYVQLYTDGLDANPGSYSHTAYADTSVGMSSDWTLDRPAGGYVVNPAVYTVNYRSTSGDTLAPSFVSGTGATLTSYLVADNPAGDFDLYYQAGDNIPLTAPGIDEYITPVAHTLALATGLNVYTFAYQTAAANENGVLSDTGSNQTVVLLVSLLALSAIGAAVIVKKTL